MMMRVATIGDGAMATVCSQIVASKSNNEQPIEVRIWGRDPVRLAEMERARENLRYLPGFKLASNVHFTGDDASVFDGLGLAGAPTTGEQGLIICAVPTQFIRGALIRLRQHIPPGVPVVSVAKGIELEASKRPSEVILEVLGDRPVAALSGPSIAGELARKLPATMVV